MIDDLAKADPPPSMKMYDLTEVNTFSLVKGESTFIKGGRTDSHEVVQILNLGPGSIWCRTDRAAAVVGDTSSLLLPAGVGDNNLRFLNPLCLMAEENTVVILRRV